MSKPEICISVTRIKGGFLYESEQGRRVVTSKAELMKLIAKTLQK